MKSPNLHDEFLNALHYKIPRKSDLTNTVSDILHIEKDSAYRRLSGKVNFSIREVGAISERLDISLDNLMDSAGNYMWFPLALENPMLSSIDLLFYKTDETLRQISEITTKPAVSGNIYNSIPLEFYISSPVLTKFMFFKWGHYFVGTKEYNDFSRWELPPQLSDLQKKVWEAARFDSIYYIWDDAIIWAHLNEVAYLYKMRIITAAEKNQIREAVGEMLRRLEDMLNGNYDPAFCPNPHMDFYVSSRSTGFTFNYYTSESQSLCFFQTNFSHCIIEGGHESFNKLKTWIDSFKAVSTLLSKSGRVERRIFFDTQHKLVDLILGND